MIQLPGRALLLTFLMVGCHRPVAAPQSAAPVDASDPAPQTTSVAEGSELGPVKESLRQGLWVTEPVEAPGTRFRVFFSEAAQTDVSYHVYLPDAYETDKTRRFPVLYWLHGHGGGLRGIPILAAHFDEAMRSGQMPPAIIVFANGLMESMWCDAQSGDVPMEAVVINDLIPDVDANYRTKASRDGRLLEGFSMGGYGAARLAFKYPHLFASASFLAAGPLQQTFTPEIGPKAAGPARRRILDAVYGGDQSHFRAQSPWVLAEDNAKQLKQGLRVRQAIGSLDRTIEFNQDFDAHLTALEIPHTYDVASGVKHNVMDLFEALGDENWAFYQAALGTTSGGK